MHFMTSGLGAFSDHLIYQIYQAHNDKCMLSSSFTVTVYCRPNSIHSCKTELQSKSSKLIAVKSQALISMCFYHFHAVQIEYSCYLLFVTVNNSHLL